MKNKGSVMVESAVVIPIIIILFVSAIALAVEFYDLVIDETRRDCERLCEGYNECQNLRRAAVIGDLLEE